jgi:hypothetical protein
VAEADERVLIAAQTDVIVFCFVHLGYVGSKAQPFGNEQVVWWEANG